MIGGMPNVGKSTIINAIRKQAQGLSHKDITKSAALPCTTKSVTGFKISESPLAYLVDTPGVMVPRINDDETGLKLSLVGCIKDTIVGKDILMDYLVWMLNKHKGYRYVERYGMRGPAGTGKELAQHVHEKFRHNNFDTTYDLVLKDFRKGELGKLTMDYVELKF